MAYQRALQPYGFTVHIAGILAAPNPCIATVPAPNFFSGASVWNPLAHLNDSRILEVSFGTRILHFINTLDNHSKQECLQIFYKGQRAAFVLRRILNYCYIQHCLWSIHVEGCASPLYNSQELHTTAHSLQVERDTRQQAGSATWKKEWSLRLTSSNFGVALSRKDWTEKGLQAITTSRNISHVPATK